MTTPASRTRDPDRSAITGHLLPRRGPSGAELRAIYDADPSISVRALAEEYRMAYGTVHRRLQRAGTKFRPQGGVRRPPTPAESVQS